MSGAEQFKAAVPERSGPTDWRGGLERNGARRGRVGRLAGGGPCGWTAIPRPRYAREKIEWNLAGCPSGVALSAVKAGVETNRHRRGQVRQNLAKKSGG